ncbi:MAG: NUDIX domain-containing protein [Nanoarchaeota archaeon]
MSKDDQEILTVKRNLLFGDSGQNYFSGFLSNSIIDFKTKILSNVEWNRRGDMEINPFYKQPIAYCLIVNPTLEKIFVYIRSNKNENYHEKRLHGKLSLGIGGHIEREDTSTEDPIYESMLRELNEEVGISGNVNARILGYINDDNDKVGQVHFGILYLIETNAIDIKPKSSELSEGKFISLNEIKEICSNPNIIIEGWSKISLVALENYFGY